MRPFIAAIVLGLLIAACAEADPVLQSSLSTTADPGTEMHDDMAMGDHEEGDHAHSEMQSLEWDGPSLPEISIDVTGDNNQGWTVTTSITNFTLTDMAASEHVPGEGHAHIWVDGQVFTMISDPIVVIPTLEPGTHEIMVSLSSNTHLDYVHDGDRLMARTTVNVGGASDHPVITVSIVKDAVTIADERPRVALGDEVELRITADVTDEVHIHGYDVTGALEPGVEAIVRFTADVPGIFEVELESTGLHLFDLQVG